MEPSMSPTDEPPDRPDRAPDSPAHRHNQSEAVKAYLKGPPRRSQRELAKKLGVNQSYVSKVVRKQRVMSTKLVFAFHELSKIPLEDLRPARLRRRRRVQAS